MPCRDSLATGPGMHRADTAPGNTQGWQSSHSALKESVNVGKIFASAEEGSWNDGEVMLEGKELPLPSVPTESSA